jgi:hypothetical protein
MGLSPWVNWISRTFTLADVTDTQAARTTAIMAMTLFLYDIS